MAQELRPVFIATSLAKKCRKRAQRLADFITHFGFCCVFGEGFGGGSISKGVRSGINSSIFVIAILSRESKTGRGRWNPPPWVVQELVLADDLGKPCLLLVEKGVRFTGGLLGDVEYISFNADSFSEVFPEVLLQVKAILRREGLTIGVKEDDPIQVYFPRIEGKKDFPKALHEKVMSLMGRGSYDEALGLAEKLTATYPKYWRGWISLGVILVKQWNLVKGGAVFTKVSEDFSSDDEACGAALHNLACVLELKSGPEPSVEALNECARLYEMALVRDKTRVYTRAALICIYALLDETEKAHALLTESALYGEEFIKAMRHELDSRGAARIKILSRLPELAQNLIYPMRQRRDVYLEIQ